MELNKKINLNVAQLIGILETHSSQANVVFDDITKKFVVSAMGINGTGFELRTAVADLADGLSELARKPRQFVKDLEHLLGYDGKDEVSWQKQSSSVPQKVVVEVVRKESKDSEPDDSSSIFAPFRNY